MHFPDGERPAARPAKTSPCYERLDAKGAVWGQRYGWERPNWFAPKGEAGADVWSFRRSNYFDAVGSECRAVRERAGLIDITSFSKFHVTGPGAEAFLDRLVANSLPKKVGAIKLTHALDQKGGVRTEFTIMRDGRHAFYLVSSGAAERYDHDLLLKQMPDDGSVQIDNVTTAHGVLVLVGPKAREILSQVTDADLSNQGFPWLSGRMINIGLAPVRAMRINFVGDLGWEIHHPIEYQNHIFDALIEAGEAHGLAMVGMRAMESLRIEKSYRMWGLDLTRDYTALEAGLDRFIAFGKGDFTGKAALEKQQAAGVPLKFVTMEVEGIEDTDPHGNEPVYRDGTMVGRATSGVYGHSVGKSLSMAYVDAAAGEIGSELEIEILGQMKAARVVPESPYDPESASLRQDG